MPLPDTTSLLAEVSDLIRAARVHVARHVNVLAVVTNFEVGRRIVYEVEATSNGWSLSELRRQFDTSLYERLASSRVG